MNRRILTAIALLLTAFPAAAAGPRLGLQARAGLNVADFSASAEGLNLSTRLGFMRPWPCRFRSAPSAYSPN